MAMARCGARALADLERSLLRPPAPPDLDPDHAKAAGEAAMLG